MKKILLLQLIIILIISCTPDKRNGKGQTESTKDLIEQDFQRNYIGTINGKLNVTFRLTNTNGKIHGFYYYNNIGTDIELSGKIEGNKITLDELDYLNNKTAQMNGIIGDSTIIGEWESLKSKKPYKLSLTETSKQIPTLPKNLEGAYKIINEPEESEKCDLTIVVSRSKGQYFYKFKSNRRTLNGKVTFSRDVNDPNINITFEGIEWAGYQGDLTHQDEEGYESEELPLPVGVGGLLEDEEITIQNYGNAMNSYFKLEDCGKKYIHLHK